MLIAVIPSFLLEHNQQIIYFYSFILKSLYQSSYPSKMRRRLGWSFNPPTRALQRVLCVCVCLVASLALKKSFVLVFGMGGAFVSVPDQMLFALIAVALIALIAEAKLFWDLI